MKNSTNRIWTIPNILTMVRALGVPLFLWLLTIEHQRGWSYAVLAVGAWTDYFDGKLARWLDQESKLGAALDPAIDRLYIAATVIGLALTHYIPWWLVGVLVLRDAWMLIPLSIYRRKTGINFVVTFTGKAATFNLLYAFPFLLLSGHSPWGQVAHTLGWSFAFWGVALYLWTAFDYSRLAFNSQKEKPRV